MKQQKVPFQQYTRIAAVWTGADDTNAPDADFFVVGAIGAAGDGASDAVTYHVVLIGTTKSWVATGATVTQLYGG